METSAHKAFHRFLALHHHLRRYERQMSEHGVRSRQFSVLRFLFENGPATVGDFQQQMHTSPSTNSTVIAGLEDTGFVTRTRSSEDNRVVIVELTAKGRDVAERAPLGGIPLLRRRLLELDTARLERIDEVLAELMDLMDMGEDG